MTNLIISLIKEELKNHTIEEMANKFFSDINEILLGYYLLDESWDNFVNSEIAKNTLFFRNKNINQEEYENQKGRAEMMAQKVTEWANQNGFNGKPKKVWWTASPNALSRALGQPIDYRKNPSDILIQFSDGSFLGVSAKSTKKSGDIGFKNIGIGSLGKAIGIDLTELVKENIIKAIEELNLPLNSEKRKQFIRNNPKIQKQTRQIGIELLNKLRNFLFNYYKENFNNQQMMKHIKNTWIDASEIFPYYIKVTGHGQGGNYSASIVDPINNDKIKALSKNKISITPVGNTTILVHTDNIKIMRIRWKWTSEPLASSIKLSGDPA